MGLVNRAIRNVWRKKTRTLLVVIALGISVAAIISVYTGVEASTNNTQEMINGYRQNLIETGELTEYQQRMIQVNNMGFGGGLFIRGGMNFDQTQTSNITSGVIENISSIEYVEEVIPLIENPVGINYTAMREQTRQFRDPGSGQFPGDGGQPGVFQGGQDMMASFYDYIIMGVPANSALDKTYLLLPDDIVSGRKITENDQSMVMIRENLTFTDGFFAGAKVGDIVSVEGYNFTVAGIYSSDDNRNYVYMNISDAEKALGLENGQAYSLNVYVNDKSYVDIFEYDIGQMYPDFRINAYANTNSFFSERMQAQQDAQIASLQQDSSKIENTGNTIITFLIIAVCLIILFLMIYTVKERTREIGLLKAIGFSGKSVMSQFILEGTAIGLIGGIIGIIIGFIAGPTISRALLPNSEVFATSTPSFLLILIILCLTTVLGAVGTIYPAWQASRKSPMEAMRNE